MPVQVKPMIAEAFIRLSKQKNIDKITVKDLVEACGISRQTFYYHFQDILEVIEWSLDQAFSHLLEQSLAADDPEAVLRGFLETSEESAELLQKLLHSQKREQVERLARPLRAHLFERGDRAQRPRAGALVRGHGHGAQLLHIRGCGAAARELREKERRPRPPRTADAPAARGPHRGGRAVPRQITAYPRAGNLPIYNLRRLSGQIRRSVKNSDTPAFLSGHGGQTDSGKPRRGLL